MGVDLRIAIIKPTAERWWLCYDRLRFDRDYDLFGLIEKMPNWTINPDLVNLDWYEDNGVKRIYTNPYGDKLVYTLSDEFAKLDIPGIKTNHDMSGYNEAILKFLAALPAGTRIVICWA